VTALPDRRVGRLAHRIAGAGVAGTTTALSRSASRAGPGSVLGEAEWGRCPLELLGDGVGTLGSIAAAPSFNQVSPLLLSSGRSNASPSSLIPTRIVPSWKKNPAPWVTLPSSTTTTLQVPKRAPSLTSRARSRLLRPPALGSTNATASEGWG